MSAEGTGARAGGPPAELTDGPLQGLKVLELGQLLAGPYVGTLLGDFGADVIKVEPPPKGDAMRDWGRLRHRDHSLWWSILARNKRSVTLNLRTEEGQEVARRLAAVADVIVENFRPGTMERWGLGPEDVHAVNPGAVYARVTGYGQTGRYRDRPGFASASEALSGLRYINGYPDQAPPRFGISLGDSLAAQSAFQGILLALYARDVRGAAGQVVDASITDACLAITESAVLEYEKTGTVRNPTGTRLPRIAPSNVYRSRDGKWVVIAANHDTLWRRLAAAARPSRSSPRTSASPPTTPEASTKTCSTSSSANGRPGIRPPSSISSSTTPGSCARRSTTPSDVYRGSLLPRAGTAGGVRGRGPRNRDRHPGVVPRLTGTPRGGCARPARWTVGADTEDGPGRAGDRRCGSRCAPRRPSHLTRPRLPSAVSELHEKETRMGHRLGVDVGGTFTDVQMQDTATGEVTLVKVLSTPARSVGRACSMEYSEACRRVGVVAGRSRPRSSTVRPWSPT